MVYCSVRGCRSNSRIKNAKMHRFPKRDPDVCAEWIKACNRPIVNINNAKMCSLHFTEDSYLLLNTTSKKDRLLANAVPTLMLPTSKKSTDISIEVDIKTKKNGTKEKNLEENMNAELPFEDEKMSTLIVKNETEINEHTIDEVKMESMAIDLNLIDKLNESTIKNEIENAQDNPLLNIKMEEDDINEIAQTSSSQSFNNIKIEEISIKDEELSEDVLLESTTTKSLEQLEESVRMAEIIPSSNTNVNLSHEDQISELQNQLKEMHKKYADQQKLLKDVVQTSKFLINKIKVKYIECECELREMRKRYNDKERDYLKLKRELEILTTTLADNYIIKA